MSNVYGYHRTSTMEQHLDRGIKEIQDFCEQNNMTLTKIFTDQQTGKDFYRPRYIVMKEDVLREGDVLVITELDRLGRNKKSTMEEIAYFKNKGIRLMVLELPTTLIDFSTMTNDMAKLMIDCINNVMLELYASMSEAEVQKKEKRQREGIQAKKERGEWDDYGRPKLMTITEFEKRYKDVKSGLIKPFELMRELGLSKSTFYRYRSIIERNYKEKDYEHKRMD